MSLCLNIQIQHLENYVYKILFGPFINVLAITVPFDYVDAIVGEKTIKHKHLTTYMITAYMF